MEALDASRRRRTIVSPRSQVPISATLIAGYRSEPAICAVTRSLSAIVACRAPDFEPIEELGRCPFGPENVTRRVLPMLRNDVAFALRL